MGEQQIKCMFVPNKPFLEEVEGYLKEGKKVCIHVRGTSMLPFLRDGDKVLLVSPRRLPVRKGSIVLAHTCYGHLLHRVICRKQDVFVLAGDANARATERVMRTDVVAVVVEAYRNGCPLHINGAFKRAIALAWLLLRPFRGYLLAIYRRINKK